MKKLLTIAALMGVASLSSYGQGTVVYAAGGGASTRQSTNSAAGGPSTGLTTGSWYYALFVADTGIGLSYSNSASLDPTLSGFALVSSPTGPYGTNTAAGRFSGNPSSTDNLVVNGRPAGTTANFVVLGWSGAIAGPDYAAFRAWYNNGANATDGWAGHSGVATGVQLGGGLIPSGSIFGANPGQVPGFLLGLNPAVPEPSTFALAGLGAAALVIFRRRKA